MDALARQHARRAMFRDHMSDVWVKVNAHEFEVSVQLPLLCVGSRGSDVLAAQALLRIRGFDIPLDGVFDQHMEDETRAMQHAYSAAVDDGKWGSRTWEAAIMGEYRL